MLKGRVVDAHREDEPHSPHYHIHALAGRIHFRIAVNVKDRATPAELLFLVDDDFYHPIIAGIQDLPLAFTPLRSRPEGLALDYIRGSLFDRFAMRQLPAHRHGADNDLSDRIERYVERAIEEHGALVYAFGHRWGPEQRLSDTLFGFAPRNGIHDIHMNQGNSHRYRADDGVYHDGALLFSFPAAQQWVAIFLAFRSQRWRTHDRTGHALK